jgi:uncharacterized damage-inducible protein DinB/predicted RNase H-like HicB family nuclease
MTSFPLYLESSRRQLKTMVHVPHLLGCTAQGPTVEAALFQIPGAIRRYLRFLRRHGERVRPKANFSTRLVEHVILTGRFAGSGSPAVVFTFDRQRLTAKELEVYLRRLQWQRDDLVALVERLTPRQIAAKPRAKGRSILETVEHILEAEAFYQRCALGKREHPAPRGTRAGGLVERLRRARQDAMERIRSLTAAQRSQSAEYHGMTWTPRKMLRRMLEHEWEHLVKLTARVR